MQLKRTTTLQQDAARCKIKHEKCATVHHEKRCDTEKVQLEKKVQYQKPKKKKKKTCKWCNMEKL